MAVTISIEAISVKIQMNNGRAEPLDDIQKPNWRTLCRRMVLGNFLISIVSCSAAEYYLRFMTGPDNKNIQLLSATIVELAPFALMGIFHAIGMLIFTRRISGGYHRFYSDVLYFRSMISFAFGATITLCLTALIS